MSRIENGQYVLAPSPVNLKETTEEILEPIKEMAKQKEVIMIIGIGVDIDHDVMLDRLSYQKIILNLLTNALKFTPPQGTVNFTLDFDEKGTHMKVSDTGIGISEKFLPHVFEPFAQENPDNSATSGSGLGLSIVKNIVDAMHGTITVKSQKGEGTTFICELPLSTQDIIEKQENEETQMDLTCLKDKQVLVCEDNALNLEIISSILKSGGIKVDSAPDGQEGYQLFMSHPDGFYDAVLLDLRMPIVNGFQCAQMIRASEKSNALTIPIIAVSADAYPENVREALASGMNTHIAKPIDAKKLLAMLVHLLNT